MTSSEDKSQNFWNHFWEILDESADHYMEIERESDERLSRRLAKSAERYQASKKSSATERGQTE